MSWSSEFEKPPPRPPSVSKSLDPSAFDNFWESLEDESAQSETDDESTANRDYHGEAVDDSAAANPISVDELLDGLLGDDPDNVPESTSPDQTAETSQRQVTLAPVAPEQPAPAAEVSPPAAETPAASDHPTTESDPGGRRFLSSDDPDVTQPTAEELPPVKPSGEPDEFPTQRPSTDRADRPEPDIPPVDISPIDPPPIDTSPIDPPPIDTSKPALDTPTVDAPTPALDPPPIVTPTVDPPTPALDPPALDPPPIANPTVDPPAPALDPPPIATPTPALATPPIVTPAPALDSPTIDTPTPAQRWQQQGLSGQVTLDDRSIGKPQFDEPAMTGEVPRRSTGDRHTKQSNDHNASVASPRQSPGVGIGERLRKALPLVLAIALGLIIGLIVAIAVNNSGTDDEEADAPATATASETGATSSSGPLGPSITARQPFDVGSLRFEPGTTQLTEHSETVLATLAEAGAADVGQLSGTIRTTSEASDVENLELGERQAAALLSRLTEAGFDPARMSVEATGRSLITHDQAAPNFVVAAPGLQQSGLRTALENLPPYAIGIDPSTDELRPESVRVLAELAATVTADTGAQTVTLAAYAFRGANAAENDQLAARAAATVQEELVNRYSIPAEQIDLIVVGDAPYSVPQEIGSHISLRWAP